MLRTTVSLGAVFTLFFAGFVVFDGGCGSDPWDLPCTPEGGCGDQGHKCVQGECLPPCKTTSDCPTHDFYGNPATLECIEGTCYPPDLRPTTGATNDAGDAGDAGKSSAICGEICTPIPDGWSSMQAFWIGPVGQAPFYGEFHGEKTLPRFIGRADLDAAPAECDECSCGESSGKCTTLPATIEVHAAMCGQAGSSRLFGGPTNWDGSCTNANSIAAGEKCPTGSSTLCAQSVTVTPLGAPVDDGCMPFTAKVPVASARLSGPVWKTTAVGYDVPGCNTNESCVPIINDLPRGFRSCIYQRGEHECPTSWNDRHVVYEVTADNAGYVDGRECTPCSCGAPVGSLCVGQFRVFEDAACTKQLAADPISSIDGQCTNIIPAGKAIGSKEITGLEYLPGVCEPIGGEAIGDAVPDPKQAVTFCCPAG